MSVEDALDISTTYEGEPIAINCPCCRKKNVPSVPQERVERSNGFTLSNVFIKCGKCGETLHVKVKELEQLYDLPPNELNRMLTPYTSFIGRAMVIVGLLLFWFPFMGLGCAVLGILLTQRRPLWQTVGGTAFFLSLIATGYIMMYIF